MEESSPMYHTYEICKNSLSVKYFLKENNVGSSDLRLAECQ